MCLCQLEGMVTLLFVPGSYFPVRDAIFIKTGILNHNM